MLLNQFISHLKELEHLSFVKQDGQVIPSNVHITEISRLSKHYIDCGNDVRKKEFISFQLWIDQKDIEHRLTPLKVAGIFKKSIKVLSLENLPIEVEYQGESIEKYELNFDGNNFILQNTYTDCLAKEACGIPNKVNSQQGDNSIDYQSNCTPEDGCC